MKFLKSLFCVSGALAMVACGGGGGDSPSTPSNNLPVVSASVSSLNIFGLDSVSVSVASSDSDGDKMTYSWRQTSPSNVRLDLSKVDSEGNLQLNIPDVVADTVFGLSLRVDDGKGAITKPVSLSVKLLPAFSVSVESTSLEVNEGEVVEFGLIFNNPRGDVSVEIQMSTLLSTEEYNAEFVEGGSVSLSVLDVAQEATYPFVVVSTDSASNVQSRVEMSVLVINASLNLKLAKLKALEESYDTLINLNEERALYRTLLDLAYFEGLVSVLDKEDHEIKFSSMLEPSNVEVVRGYLVGHKNRLDVSDEAALDIYIANFDEAFYIYTSLVNSTLLQTSAKLKAGIVPDMVLGNYAYDASNNKYSQFWGNPDFGRVDSGAYGWVFNDGFSFFKDFVFPENQPCNLLEQL
jgi:hypothetical protein